MIEGLLALILTGGVFAFLLFYFILRKIMQSLSDLQAAVAAEDTVIDSAVTLLNGIAAQIAALTPDQAAIDALASDVQAKTAALSSAVTANTPVA